MEALIRQVQQQGCLSHGQLYGAPVLTHKAARTDVGVGVGPHQQHMP